MLPAAVDVTLRPDSSASTADLMNVSDGRGKRPVTALACNKRVSPTQLRVQ